MAQDQSVSLSEEKEQRSLLLEIQIVAAFFLLLLGLDTFRVLVVLPWEAHLPDVLATVVEVVVKGSFFVGLTYGFVAYIEKPREGVWEFLLLKKNLGRGVATGFAGSLLLVILFLFFAPKPVGANSLNGFSQIILAGLFEEIPFRGYLLRKFQGSMGMDYNAAILLTSALFVCIHLPLWLSSGASVKVLTNSAVIIFALAILLGLAVRFSKSLWSSVIIHTANNLIQLFL